MTDAHMVDFFDPQADATTVVLLDEPVNPEYGFVMDAVRVISAFVLALVAVGVALQF
jgi:hypothetical protein